MNELSPAAIHHIGEHLLFAATLAASLGAFVGVAVYSLWPDDPKRTADRSGAVIDSDP